MDTLRIKPPHRLSTVSSRMNSRLGGFTLIEIVVVVAIIGVMVLAIGLNISRDTDRLAKWEAERFFTIVSEVRDEAIISGQNIFLIVDSKAGRYSFESASGKSLDTSSASLFGPRDLERGVSVQWQVFEQLDEEDQATQKKVLITALGEITPFEAIISGQDNKFVIELDDRSRLVKEKRQR